MIYQINNEDGDSLGLIETNDDIQDEIEKLWTKIYVSDVWENQDEIQYLITGLEKKNYKAKKVFVTEINVL